MFINLFNTLKKNLYGVSTDKGEIKFYNSNANINKTSNIFTIDNNIEFLKNKNKELEQLFKEYEKKIDFKDFSTIISLILLIISLVSLLFGIKIPDYQNLLYFIFFVSMLFSMIILTPNLIMFFSGDDRKSLVNKQKACQEKINKNKELILKLTETSKKEKKEVNLYEIDDNDYINNLTIDSLDLNKDNNIKVRKLVKEENKR